MKLFIMHFKAVDDNSLVFSIFTAACCCPKILQRFPLHTVLSYGGPKIMHTIWDDS